jgi:glycosyltransferase involved in cell wall biosynthesis
MSATILHLSNNPECVGWGGTEVFMQNLIQSMPDLNHIIIGQELSTQVASGSNITKHVFSFSRGNFNIKFRRLVEFIFLPWTFLMTIYGIINYWKEFQKADVISFSNGSMVSVFTYAPLLKLLLKKRLIYIHHGPVPKTRIYTDFITAYYVRFCFNLCTNTFLCQSQMNQWTEAGIKPQNAKLIFTGTKIPDHINIFEPKELTFGFLGRFDHVKGLDILIPAINKFKPSKKTIFKFMGEGNIKDDLKALIKLEYPELVEIQWLPFSNKIDKFYSSISYLIISSRSEGFSLVSMEASVRGLPILSSPIPSLIELSQILSTENLVLSENTSSHWLKKLQQIDSGSINYSISMRDRISQLATDNFNIKNTCAKYKELYLLK